MDQLYRHSNQFRILIPQDTPNFICAKNLSNSYWAYNYKYPVDNLSTVHFCWHINRSKYHKLRQFFQISKVEFSRLKNVVQSVFDCFPGDMRLRRRCWGMDILVSVWGIFMNYNVEKRDNFFLQINLPFIGIRRHDQKTSEQGSTYGFAEALERSSEKIVRFFQG